MLSLNSMVQGYHEYKRLWTNPFDGEKLICEREIGNTHLPFSIAFGGATLLKQLLGSSSSSSCIAGAHLKYFKINIEVFQ